VQRPPGAVTTGSKYNKERTHTICKHTATLSHWSSRVRALTPVTYTFIQSLQVDRTEWIENDNNAGTWLLRNAFPFRNPPQPSSPLPTKASPDSITDKKGRSIPQTVSWESNRPTATAYISLQFRKARWLHVSKVFHLGDLMKHADLIFSRLAMFINFNRYKGPHKRILFSKD
jgi:hypothetical protein